MKIQDVKRAPLDMQALHGRDVKGAKDGGELRFRRTLTDLSEDVFKNRLLGLKEKIDEQGERVADKVDVRELERYRRLIREFLDEIVSNGYTFSREDTYASRGRHRFIATVQIVDRKIDELGKELLKEHADKIEILSRLDDIRGLLLDLLQ